MKTAEGRWVKPDELSELTGFSLKSIRAYGNRGKIKQRGEPKVREYLYTGQKKSATFGGGRPAVLSDRPKTNPNSITGDYYTSDHRVKNTAWLAEYCMKRDLSFSVEFFKVRCHCI